MHVVQVNYPYAPAVTDPEELLEGYRTLTEWSEAVRAVGDARLSVVQRFSRDAQLTRNGVEYYFRADSGSSFPRPWTFPRRLHDAVAALRPDVAHVNGLHFPVQTRLLRRAVPAAALVLQDHADGFHKDWLRRAVHRMGLGVADAFLFAAAELAQPWQRAGLIGPDQPVYEVMESSTTLQPLPRRVAHATSHLAGRPAVLWVGRLNSNKDPLTVLEGFERALSGLPHAHLTMIYHSDELLPSVQARLAVTPLLAERVHLLGRVSHTAIAAFYSAADLFVLGSHREGSGYALIEALACGAVPIVTDIPTFRAMTAEGSLGMLWPPGSAAALAAALAQLGQRDLDPLRAAIATHFDRELTWAAVGRRAMEAYRDVAARRGAPQVGTRRS